MKRGAEKYLTDRNVDEQDDDEEVQETSSSEGFKQAAPTELARRPIRGLPGKRSAATTPAASPGPNGVAPTPMFSFGSPAPASAFTFGGVSPAPAPSTVKPATNAKAFSFGSASNDPSKAQKIASKQPSSDQDADVQYYMSLRGLNLSVIPPVQRLIDKDPFTDLSEALSKIHARYREERSSIEAKRKTSLSTTTSGQQESSSKQSTSMNDSASPAEASKPVFSFAAPSTTSSGQSTPAAPAVPPAAKPFAGFAFGGAATPPTAAIEPTKDTVHVEEQLSVPKPFSGFSFGSASASSPAPASSKKTAEDPKPPGNAQTPDSAAAKAPAPPVPPTVFSFAGNTFKPDPTRAVAPPSESSTPGGFIFNPSKAESSGDKSAFAFPAASATPAQDKDKLSPEPVANGKSASNNLSGSAAPFFPGTNSRARQPSPLRQVETVPAESKSKADVDSKESPAAPKPFSGFSFGTSAASTSTPSKPFSFGAAAAASPKSTSTFGFGTSGTSPKSSTAHVGFSFGSPQPTPSSTSAPSASAFSFGAPSASGGSAPDTTSAFSSTKAIPGNSGGFGLFSFKPSTGSTFGSPSIATTPASSSNGTPAPESENTVEEAQTPSENTLLKGGAGEENEETIYEARAKLWKNEKRKAKDGESEEEKTDFVDHGISIVKLNRDKATGKVRMLARSDANGRVQINFALFKDLTIRSEKSFLIFMAFENGSPMLLRLKLRNAELAGNLKNAIEEEMSKLT